MFILEGNIGAGKSTFLRLVKNYFPSISVVQEQVNNWQQERYGQSLLANFYEQPQRWAYTFEALTAICRVQEHLIEQKRKDVSILERSIYSGFYCFAYNSYQAGFLSHLEWKVYEAWFSFLVDQSCKDPKGFIYLRVSPEIAYERVRKRNRSSEKTISLDYLKQIHERHESLFIRKEGVPERFKQVPVLIVDGDQEFEQDKKQLQNHFSEFTSFFSKNLGITESTNSSL